MFYFLKNILQIVFDNIKEMGNSSLNENAFSERSLSSQEKIGSGTRYVACG